MLKCMIYLKILPKEMNNPKYNPYQCPRCLLMEFSYFDDGVHRWCKGFDSALTAMDVESLKIKREQCKKYNHPKGSKKKAKYLGQHDYLRKYPE